MNLKQKCFKFLAVTILALLLFEVTSCGSIIYRERVFERHSRRIDPKVAIMDGILTFFFLVPGLVAFGIDFATGAIFLPHGRKAWSKVDDPNDITVVQVDPEKLDKEMIEKILSEYTGKKVILDEQDLQVFTGSDIKRDKVVDTLAAAGIDKVTIF